MAKNSFPKSSAQTLAPPTEAERDLIRQGERTVDNLKRLFAVVFAVSFGVVGQSVIEKIKPIITGLSSAAPTFQTFVINVEMVAVFIITAGVFYHQSAKFLDIRYAKHPLAQAHPYGFALDYGTLVLTAAPFFLMAHSLSPSVTHEVGYLPFFGSYVILLSFGLVLLAITQLRHSGFVRNNILKENIPLEELTREGTLRRYWLVMNSGVLLTLLVGFSLAAQLTPCPTTPAPGDVPYFLYFFGLVALGRDFLDFRYSWRFLYPIPAEEAEALDRWPLTAMTNSHHPWLWSTVGYLLILLIVIVILQLRLFEVARWTSICATA